MNATPVINLARRKPSLRMSFSARELLILQHNPRPRQGSKDLRVPLLSAPMLTSVDPRTRVQEEAAAVGLGVSTTMVTSRLQLKISSASGASQPVMIWKILQALLVRVPPSCRVQFEIILGIESRRETHSCNFVGKSPTCGWAPEIER